MTSSSGTEVHNECIFSQSPGLTIRNSTFVNCATMDLFIIRGDWWGQPTYGGVTLENNVFGHSTNGSGWHYYGVYFSNGSFQNHRSSTTRSRTPSPSSTRAAAPYSGVWANNIGGGWSCLSGVIYRNNIGTKCDASDIATTPQHSCAPPACGSAQWQPVGWLNPAQGDFHLRSDSIAINKGSATYAPAKDRDGKARTGVPDVGAFEF